MASKDYPELMKSTPAVAGARSGKLLNVFFPLWFIFLFPAAWLIALPVNFGIDLLVVFVSFSVLRVEDKWRQIWRTIFLVWIIGFGADIVGAVWMMLSQLMHYFTQQDSGFAVFWNEQIAVPVAANPFTSVLGALWVLVAIGISAVIIFFADRWMFSKLTKLDKPQIHKASLWLAIFTAPYLFLFPTEALFLIAR